MAVQNVIAIIRRAYLSIDPLIDWIYFILFIIYLFFSV